MFFSHSLIPNALVNVIKHSQNLKFAKNKKVTQDGWLKLVQEKKASGDFNAENLYHCVNAGTKRANILALM